MRIQIHVDRLILNGVPLDRRFAPHFKAAVEVELGRLFTEQIPDDTLLSGTATPFLRVEPIQIGTNVTPATLGRNVAKAVHGGLQQ